MITPSDSNDDDNGNNDFQGFRPQGMSLDSRVYLLAERIKNLRNDVKQLKDILSADKIDMIKRLSKLEITYQRVFGIVLVFPILGAILGFIATYWSVLFKPWTR